VLQKNEHQFNGVFSRQPGQTGSRTVKTNLDFHETRDDGMAVASAGPYANHLQVAPDR